MIIKYVLPAVAFALLIFAIVHVASSQRPQEPVSPPVEPARAPFTRTVAGAGIVEAQTENIEMGAPIAGLVVEVPVQVGDKVPPGTTLFRLDDRPLRAQLKVAEAALAAAEAQLERLEKQPRPEEVPVAEAAVRRAEADLVRRQDQLRRSRTLHERGAVTDEELILREQDVRMGIAELERSQAELALLNAGAWEADKLVARAAIEQAQADISRIQTDLERLEVKALVDGEVLQVNVRPGEFIGAPAEVPAIVLGNVQRLHVRVDIDEQDIPRFVPNAPARATQRGLPQSSFPLTFVRIEPFVVPKRSLTGLNTERVDTRVLQVIYAVESTDQPLYVGQQVDVFIDAAGSAAAPIAQAER